MSTYDFLFAAVPPVIVLHPHCQMVEFYFDVSLVCGAVGDDLKYQWTYRGNIITANSHYSISVLVISDIKLPDSGQYQCLVSNSNGTVVLSSGKW